MENIIDKIDIALAAFEPITLAEMSGIRLMNRMDTKYMINIDQLPDLLAKAKADYFVQEIDGLRKAFYYTVYYDTPDAEMFVIHHNKKRNRQKIRIREYVESNQYFLEVKDKDNKGRTTKIRIPVKNENVLDKVEAVEFLSKKSHYRAEQLNQRLKNNYFRITLVNKEKTERLTIDIDLHFSNCLTGIDGQLSGLCIIEVKQEGDRYSPIKDYLAELRIKKSSISKYCLGMVLTDSNLKTNNFKRKLIYIHKLLNHGIINTPK